MSNPHVSDPNSLQSKPFPFRRIHPQDRWHLVAVNPGLILGPCVTDYIPEADSFSRIKKFADGTMKAGVPPYEIGMVDVRDVAEAHLRAGFRPGAEGRHIIFSRADNSKSKQSLGMQYCGVEQAITDMFLQMIELDAVYAPQALAGHREPGTS